MKIIIKIEPLKNKYKVTLDDETSFLLYKGDLKSFKLETGVELDTEKYNQLMDLLYKRAKERALYILDKTPKTQKQIKDKLIQGLYPEEIVDRVIIFLNKYDILNDYRYASTYIEYKSLSKSKKQIMQDLMAKGIDKDTIAVALEDSEYSDAKSLKNLINKKVEKYDLSDKKGLQKLYQYLFGKGYSYSDVKAELSDYLNGYDEY